MMKINNKGFMMAEIIIVSTIIISTLVGLYTIFNKLYINYKERSYYYNVDTVYVLKTIYDELIETKQMINLATKVENNDYTEFELQPSSSNNIVSIYNDNNNIHEPIISQYGINKLILVKYDKDDVKSLLNNNYSETLNDYLRYLINITDFPEKTLNEELEPDERYEYMFIVEFKNGNNYYYYGNYRIG